MRQNLEMLKFTITDFQMFYWGYAFKINRRITMTFEWRCYIYCLIQNYGDGRGRDSMVVGFTTTCAISAYYH